MNLKCIAIDDDPLSLQNLSDFLSRLPNIELIESYTNPLQAAEEIKALPFVVDLVFIDIEMPSLSGIELSSIIKDKFHSLIVTTAHTRYALDAFNIHADAYLLKPYSLLKFIKAVNKALLNRGDGNQNVTILENQYIYIRHDNKENLQRIILKDLISIEDLKHSLVIKTTKGSYNFPNLKFDSITKIFLDLKDYIQVSQRTIVAKKHIRKVNGITITMSDAIPVTISGSYKNSFFSYIKENSLQTKIRSLS